MTIKQVAYVLRFILSKLCLAPVPSCKISRQKIGGHHWFNSKPRSNNGD